jgi:hypothetical protein
MSRLYERSIGDGRKVIDTSLNNRPVEVYQVDTPQTLTQAAGYLKYIHAKDDSEGIFYRGENRLHEGLVPSLFRGCTDAPCAHTRTGSLNQYMAQLRISNTLFGQFDCMLHEPLLQHYGIRTTWIDLVDNLWVALWFAANKAFYTGDRNQYLHFERLDLTRLRKDYIYLLLIGATNTSMTSPGYFPGPQTELVDLRVGTPSVFLRPHSQHAVLFRLKGDAGSRALDYSSALRGIIRVRLADAIQWLGDGLMLTPHYLFPSPVYDQGYHILLKANATPGVAVGAINHVGV